MSKPPLFPSTSVSGIVNDPYSQQRVIPESRRADGSIRKERKVKPGFTPAEDVTRFRSSRQLDAERRKLPPGSVVGYSKPSTHLETAKAALSKSAKKNAKRKENRASASAHQETPDAWDDQDQPPASASKSEPEQHDVENQPQSGSQNKDETGVEEKPKQQDPAKRALNLSKKIKQAESLLTRSQQGDKLLPEQQVKVDALEQMRTELESLNL
ncbi:hypothetical protein ACQY0O_003505 [Thecaphora frezii]